MKEEVSKMMREVYITRRLVSHICVNCFGQYQSGVMYSWDQVDSGYENDWIGFV